MGGRRKCQRLERSKAGFTLVEMIVALALMSLLLTLAGVNGLRYHRYALWRKQEGYARSIYLAVQSELMKRAGEGRLSQLEGLFAPEDALDLNGLIGADGQELTAEAVWPLREGAVYVLEAPMGSLPGGRSDVGPDGPRDMDGGSGVGIDERAGADIDEGSSVDIDGGSGADIDGGSGAEEEKERRKLQALYDILSPYIADRSILQEGSIRIELDPSAGLVYGVFYSSYHPGGFRCGREESASALALDSEKGDITDRRVEARREQMIGYYGVDTLPGTVEGRAEKPAIRHIGLDLEDGAGSADGERSESSTDGEGSMDGEDSTGGEGSTDGVGSADGEESVDGSIGKRRLLLHWQMEAKDMAAWKDLTYEVRIYGRFREDAPIFGDEADDGDGLKTRQVICTILLDPEPFSKGRGAGYPGIPSRLLSLVPEDGYQAIQAVVRQDGVERWYCFPVMLDEAGYQIFLVLDRWGLPAEDDTLSGSRLAGRAASGSDGESGNSDGVLPWFSLREQVEGAGWGLDQLEGISCTVVGYGDDYVDTRMKESNWQPLDLAGEESGEIEEEDGGSEDRDRELESKDGESGDRGREPEPADREAGGRSRELEPADKGGDLGATDRESADGAGELGSEDKGPADGGRELVEPKDRGPADKGGEPEAEDRGPEAEIGEPEIADREPADEVGELETEDKETADEGGAPEAEDREIKDRGREPEDKGGAPEAADSRAKVEGAEAEGDDAETGTGDREEEDEGDRKEWMG